MPFVYAEVLAGISLTMGILKFAVPGWGILNYSTTPPEQRIAAMGSIGASIALVLVLLYFGKRGKMWARYVLALLFGIGVVALRWNAGPEFGVSFASGVLVVTQAVLQALAIAVLVWRPRSETL